jgi:hypothetical protein
MTSTATGARCALHPDVAAVATCSRCGSFLCGDCTELVGETLCCAACMALRRRDAKPSPVVQAALGLNVMGLVCLPCSMGLPLPSLVAGLAGVVLATRELRRIRRGESAERGRTQARVVRALGWLNLGLSTAWLVVLARMTVT